MNQDIYISRDHDQDQQEEEHFNYLQTVQEERKEVKNKILTFQEPVQHYHQSIDSKQREHEIKVDIKKAFKTAQKRVEQADQEVIERLFENSIRSQKNKIERERAKLMLENQTLRPKPFISPESRKLAAKKIRNSSSHERLYEDSK